MSTRNAIYQAIFERCPGHAAPGSLAGETLDQRIRGTICHPRETLAVLRQEFSECDLLEARAARQDSFGQLHLAPELCLAGGRILPLREDPAGLPFDLLTARGSLAGGSHPVLSALRDGRISRLASEEGLLLATPRIQDVALLDALGLPVTSGWSLPRLELPECRQLDAAFGEGLPVFEASDLEPVAMDSSEEPVAPETPDWQRLGPEQSSAIRPALVLTDPLGRAPESAPSLWLQRSACWLHDVQQRARLPLAGVWVWQPDADFARQWEFACRSGEPELMREAVLEATQSLVDLETFVESLAAAADGPPAEPPGYLVARRRVMERLIAGTRQPWTNHDALADALADCESAVERELVAPLIAWALGHPEPWLRTAGTQLAEVVTLLHRIAPRMQALQAERLAASRCGEELSLGGLFEQYMRLLDRFGRLTAEITKWMKS
jgi:hypothetical protein